MGDINAMSVDASGLTSSNGSVNVVVCADGSTTLATGSGGAVMCLGSTESQVGFSVIDHEF